MGSDPRSGAWRLARAVLLAGVTLGLAVPAHAAGGGGSTGPAALLVAALVATLGSIWLTGRVVRPGTALGWLALTQLGLHHLLTALSADVGPTGHHAGPAETATVAASAGAEASSLSMLAAHAVATVLTAAAIGLGDRLLFLLWDLLRPQLPRLDGPRPAVPAPLVAAPLRAAGERAAYRMPWRRGPPCVA
ncbi:MAG TPA: hypothetical protein P5181_05015 [Dermatophilaceae bacterium]|nr:hypothetical protein [Dermatophilaceae bacterium]